MPGREVIPFARQNDYIDRFISCCRLDRAIQFLEKLTILRISSLGSIMAYAPRGGKLLDFDHLIVGSVHSLRAPRPGRCALGRAAAIRPSCGSESSHAGIECLGLS